MLIFTPPAKPSPEPSQSSLPTLSHPAPQLRRTSATASRRPPFRLSPLLGASTRPDGLREAGTTRRQSLSTLRPFTRAPSRAGSPSRLSSLAIGCLLRAPDADRD